MESGPKSCAQNGHLLCFNYKGFKPFTLRVVYDPKLSPSEGGWLDKLGEWKAEVVIFVKGNPTVHCESKWVKMADFYNLQRVSTGAYQGIFRGFWGLKDLGV